MPAWTVNLDVHPIGYAEVDLHAHQAVLAAMLDAVRSEFTEDETQVLECLQVGVDWYSSTNPGARNVRRAVIEGKLCLNSHQPLTRTDPRSERSDRDRSSPPTRKPWPRSAHTSSPPHQPPPARPERLARVDHPALDALPHIHVMDLPRGATRKHADVTWSSAVRRQPPQYSDFSAG